MQPDIYEAIANQPICLLSHDDKFILTCLLTPKKVLLSENGLHRDWRGLAVLAGLSKLEINNIQNRKCEQILSNILELWQRRNKHTVLIGKLFDCLKLLDRYDIYDDLYQLMKEELLTNSKKYKNTSVPVSHNEECLTFDDKLYGIQTYHAYILYSDDNDDFVYKMKEKMNELSNREMKQVKICTKHDLLPGACTPYVPVSKLIMERCHHIVVVYSPCFFDNPSNQFFINYSLALSIDECNSPCMIVPCVVGDCQLPDVMNKYVTLEYHPNRSLTYDFWEKLFNTITKPTRSKNIKVYKNHSNRLNKKSPTNESKIEKPVTEILRLFNTNFSRPKNKSKTEIIKLNSNMEYFSSSSELTNSQLTETKNSTSLHLRKGNEIITEERALENDMISKKDQILEQGNSNERILGQSDEHTSFRFRNLTNRCLRVLGVVKRRRPKMKPENQEAITVAGS